MKQSLAASNPRTALPVTCGIIERDGKVLCTRRSATMSLPLKWEFPGGKIDEGESPEDCFRRELREELGIEAEIGRSLPPLDWAEADIGVVDVYLESHPDARRDVRGKPPGRVIV